MPASHHLINYLVLFDKLPGIIGIFALYCTMLSGMSEFPTYHFFVQFSFLENIRYMLTYRCPSFIKQLSYLCYIQPYSFILQSNIKFYPLVRLIDNHLTQIQALRIPVIWSKSFPVKIISGIIK